MVLRAIERLTGKYSVMPQESKPFVVAFKNNKIMLRVDSFQLVSFALTFICYSRDGVSVQHSIQEGVWRLGNLENKNRAALVGKELGCILRQNGWKTENRTKPNELVIFHVQRLWLFTELTRRCALLFANSLFTPGTRAEPSKLKIAKWRHRSQHTLMQVLLSVIKVRLQVQATN